MKKEIPNNIEAEQSVLGSMLLSKYALQKAVETLTTDSFFLDKHAKIFSALKNLQSKKGISGVPRMTPTSMRVSHLRGLKRLMEPKEITSPRGSAPARVTKNSRSVCPKPSFSERNTMGICSAICRISSCMETQPLSRNRGNRREAVSPQDEPMFISAR